MDVVSVHGHLRRIYELIDYLLTTDGSVISWWRNCNKWLSMVWTLWVVSQDHLVLLGAWCFRLSLAASWFTLWSSHRCAWVVLINCSKVSPWIFAILVLVLDIVIVSGIAVKVVSTWCSDFMETFAAWSISWIGLSLHWHLSVLSLRWVSVCEGVLFDVLRIRVRTLLA